MKETGKLWLAFALLAVILGVSVWQNFSLAQRVDSLNARFEDLVKYAAPEGLNTLLAAKKEGKIVFYTGMIQVQAERLMSEFNKKYPWITTEFYRSTTYSVYQKYMAEVSSGKVACDAINLGDPTLFMDLKDKSNLMRYDSPEYANYPEGFKDPGYWSAFFVNVVGIGYNTKYVKPTNLTSWQSLLKPEYKGKVTISDARTDADCFTAYYLLRKLYGVEFWQKIAQQGTSVEGGSAVVADKLASGEKWIGISGGQTVAEVRDVRKAPIDAFFPPEGVAVPSYPIGIVAQAPHPNCARLFMDWALSNEGQNVIAGFSRGSMRKDGPAPAGLPALSKLKYFPTDWKEFLATRESLQKEFAQIFGL